MNNSLTRSVAKQGSAHAAGQGSGCHSIPTVKSLANWNRPIAHLSSIPDCEILHSDNGANMAIENELKFVLCDGASLEARLAAGATPQRIEQAYLGANTRIRRINGQTCLFTYKHRLPDGTSIEIETQIDSGHFGVLARDCARSLRKHRFKLSAGLVTGDVDFFKSDADGANYFAMAEAEMPAGMAAPPSIHPLLQPHVLFAVPRQDRRFSSFLLTDEAYARAKETDLLASARQDFAAD